MEVVTRVAWFTKKRVRYIGVGWFAQRDGDGDEHRKM